MLKPSAKTTKVIAAATTPIAVLAAGAMVWQASNAAFTGQTRNSGNEWSTGQVALTDDDTGSARFTATNMLPGDTQTKCIKVTANATVDGLVKGYAVNPVLPQKDLADHLFITIRAGDGGTFTDCTGFVAQEITVNRMPLTQMAMANSFASGMGGWNVAPGANTRTYEITWEFDTTSMTQNEIDQTQGDRAGIDVQWELQSN